MSRFGDLSGVVHVLAPCHMRCGNDLLESDMHIRADMYTASVDMFVHSNLSALSIVRGDFDLRRRQLDVCRVYDLPGLDHVPGHLNLRTAGANSLDLQHL